MIKRLLFFILLYTICSASQAQNSVALKSNLLYGIGTLTPNLGVEVGLGEHTTIELIGGYNWRNLDGEYDSSTNSMNDNKKIVHWVVMPEFRYFLCERFSGHFFGLHAIFSQYNIGGYELPLLLGSGSKDYRYEGYAIGAGVSYGYQMVLSRHLNAEFNVGVGYMRMNYDKYLYQRCGRFIESGHRNYFGPTRLGISLIYLI